MRSNLGTMSRLAAHITGIVFLVVVFLYVEAPKSAPATAAAPATISDTDTAGIAGTWTEPETVAETTPVELQPNVVAETVKPEETQAPVAPETTPTQTVAVPQPEIASDPAETPDAPETVADATPPVDETPTPVENVDNVETPPIESPASDPDAIVVDPDPVVAPTDQTSPAETPAEVVEEAIADAPDATPTETVPTPEDTSKPSETDDPAATIEPAATVETVPAEEEKVEDIVTEGISPAIDDPVERIDQENETEAVETIEPQTPEAVVPIEPAATTETPEDPSSEQSVEVTEPGIDEDAARRDEEQPVGGEQSSDAQPDESGALVVAEPEDENTKASQPLHGVNLEVLDDGVYWIDPRHDLEAESSALPEIGMLVLLTPIPGYKGPDVEAAGTESVPAGMSDLSDDAVARFIHIVSSARRPVVVAALPGAHGAAFFKGAYLLARRGMDMGETLLEIDPELNEAGPDKEEIVHRLMRLDIEAIR